MKWPWQKTVSPAGRDIEISTNKDDEDEDVPAILAKSSALGAWTHQQQFERRMQQAQYDAMRNAYGSASQAPSSQAQAAAMDSMYGSGYANAMASANQPVRLDVLYGYSYPGMSRNPPSSPLYPTLDRAMARAAEYPPTEPPKVDEGPAPVELPKFNLSPY